jgi:hypothetical protein
VDGDDVEEPLANEMDWTTALKAAVLHNEFVLCVSFSCCPPLIVRVGNNTQEGP